MTSFSKRIILVAVLVASLISVSTAGDKNSFDLSLRHEAQAAVTRALDYLAAAQEENGSFNDYPGISGLAMTGFARAPAELRKKHEATIVRGFKYLLTNVQDDGGIYPPFEPQLKAYNSSICLMALVAAEAPSFEQQIIATRGYLISLQADEDDGISPDSSTYGGIGYNKDERSDISNMQFALEAIRTSESYASTDQAAVTLDGSLPESTNEDLFWEKAILFLQNSQNYKKYNDYEWSSDDGGFVYYPGVSKAGATTSYGGMTYAGMKSLIHAGLTPDDERVQAAYRWIKSNYTVDTNPELGKQGLFYYYHVMAKALTLLGEPTLIDADGAGHDWRGDLADKLISIQAADGSWVNENGRWWENNPVLVTAYCVLTLQELLKPE
ncbi:MAG: hypothetical protein OEV49_08800 [candidate division Zixibacteria bacterium]|nr:hypothetical protein [candidate division Zixibacteria bacterium]MDH3937737.1 hypothetical protein [candidate division Zixibacteria bacterium]MDH4033077.1 hypothetical protein [candidate division Zixibacteria bacterium]